MMNRARLLAVLLVMVAAMLGAEPSMARAKEEKNETKQITMARADGSTNNVIRRDRQMKGSA
jgi:hypothetical protein